MKLPPAVVEALDKAKGVPYVCRITPEGVEAAMEAGRTLLRSFLEGGQPPDPSA